ncbi:MAG: N-acetyltransferase family protein [Thermoanaerobaculia bacterium]
MEIRAAAAEDIGSIARIHVACWQAAYRGILPDETLDALRVEQREQLWRGWIAGPGVHALVAVHDDGRIVGFTRLCPARPLENPPAAAAEVTHLYVDPAIQARGTGRALLERALEIARASGYGTLILWVLEGNRSARRFYERLGLSPDGARHTDPDYLGNEAAELRYVMPIPASVTPGPG